MSDSLEYNRRELAVARDPSHPNHILPPVKPHHRAILDVGCGMGQTLLALDLPPSICACGIDPDAAAIAAGRALAPSNVNLAVGHGEQLPWAEATFDLVVCRVALPYMHIPRALAEMHRVLKPDGDLWLVLHSFRMFRRHALRAVRELAVGDVAFSSFVGLNSLLFHATGKQWVIGNRTETFQTRAGMHRALSRAGFTGIAIHHDHFFLAEARKPV